MARMGNRRTGSSGGTTRGPTVDSSSHVNGGIALTPLMLLSGIIVFGTAFFIISQVQITSTEQTIFDLMASGFRATTDTGAQIGQFISQKDLDHDHLIANTIGWSVQVALFLLSIPVAQALMLVHRVHNSESSASLSATAQKYADGQTFCVRALVGGDVLTDFYFVVRGHVIVTWPSLWPSVTGFDFGVILVGLIYPVAICFVTVFCGRLFLVCVEVFVIKHVLHKA
jgi:hypothetical protein